MVPTKTSTDERVMSEVVLESVRVSEDEALHKLAVRCENCPLRKLAEKNSNSLVVRLARWHTGWCPGWKAYQRSLSATVLFTDLVSSTTRLVALGDRGWAELLERHDELVRGELSRFGGLEMDTAGDGFFAVFPEPRIAVECALAISQALRALDLEVRVGIHAGDCVVAGTKCTGLAVHIGARLAKIAEPGEVLVSESVTNLLTGSGIRFRERGTAALKGVPGEVRLYAVSTAAPR